MVERKRGMDTDRKPVPWGSRGGDGEQKMKTGSCQSHGSKRKNENTLKRIRWVEGIACSREMIGHIWDISGDFICTRTWIGADSGILRPPRLHFPDI